MKSIWYKKDLPKEKNGYKVYSCFACGGGSSFGYKLAGYDVIGATDIDPEMAEIYQKNHNPKYYHLMDIRQLLKEDLPEEMYHLDILDGSPPCSSFSMAGKREKKWGEKKKFREGQAEQTLDDLFFYFIDLAKKLQPKIVVAENVKGLISGNAKEYVVKIFEAFNKAGYETQLFLLNSSNMGVPQRRERVFFIARRKDLKLPKIEFNFNDIKPVFFKDVRTDKGLTRPINLESKMGGLWLHRKKSDINYSTISQRILKKKSYFSENIIHDDKIPQTIVSGSSYYLFDKPTTVSSNDLISIQSFPQDYDFIKNNSYGFIKYVLGMSVPPFMTYEVAKTIKKLLLDKA